MDLASPRDTIIQFSEGITCKRPKILDVKVGERAQEIPVDSARHHGGTSTVGDATDGVFSQRVLMVGRNPAEAGGLRMKLAMRLPLVGVENSIVGMVMADEDAMQRGPCFEVNLRKDCFFSGGRALEENLGDLGGGIHKNCHDGVSIGLTARERVTRMRRNHLIDMNTFSRSQLVRNDGTLEDGSTSLFAELTVGTLGAVSYTHLTLPTIA